MVRTLRHKLPAIIAMACFLATPLHGALAHGGGLNRDGCHRETATGGYHCHRDDDDDVDWETIGYVVGGLVVLGVLAGMAKPNKFAARSEETATHRWKPVEWRPYANTDGEYGLRVYTGLRF